MESDMGQSYVLIPTSDRRYRIRLYDAEDKLIQGGKIYEFEMPKECLNGCPQAFQEVTLSSTVSSSERISVPPMSSSQSSGASSSNQETIGLLKASVQVRSEWSAGFCADLTVKNVGSQALSAWSLLLKTQGNDIAQSWNLSVSREGQGFRLEPSESWSKILPPQGESTGLGFCMNVPWRSDLLEMTL
jgi:cellulase/cellobiase CelA1